jgi:hypothetical protein
MRRWLLLGLLLASAACSRATEGPSPAWDLAVASGHAEADRLIDAGDQPGARRVLEGILGAVPPTAPAPTRRVLLQDTRFRLARLALAARDPAAALQHAEAGLALGGERDLFVANLRVVRGAAHETLGHNAAAVEDYQAALAINEALLRETVPTP